MSRDEVSNRPSSFIEASSNNNFDNASEDSNGRIRLDFSQLDDQDDNASAENLREDFKDKLIKQKASFRKTLDNLTVGMSEIDKNFKGNYKGSIYSSKL